MPDTLDLFVGFGSISVEGPEPFVDVSGEVNDDGSFRAAGAGTVAGYPDIAVIFEGNVTHDTLTGEYLIGLAACCDPSGVAHTLHITSRSGDILRQRLGLS